MDKPALRPIIIKRGGEAQRHAHHGGAWKVAYADFVTAMMAFFLLLWLVSSANQATLRGLAEFFSDATVHTGPPGGAGGVLDGFSLLPVPLPMPPSPFDPAPVRSAAMTEVQPFAELTEDEAADAATLSETLAAPSEEMELSAAAATVLTTVAADPELRAFRDRLAIDLTEEGLRVQLLDGEQLAMFPVGSAVMYPHTQRLLGLVVGAVAAVPNRLSIRGHTDALPFAPGADYDNWSLSSDRANATRRVMLAAGLEPSRVAEVVGKGDGEPLLPQHADDPRNRRISIVLLRQTAPPEGACTPSAQAPCLEQAGGH